MSWRIGRRFGLKQALAAGSALAPLCGFASAALAQTPQQQNPPAQQQAQDEEALRQDVIVVSARRREESLIDVPIAVTAFSGDQLEKIGATNVTSLNEIVPNVTFEVSRNTNSTLTPFIRGVGQQDPVAGFEQGVGVYLDDIVFNRPQGAVLDLYDVERIEVLRGPQGTLYGRNTIGGAVKYVTKRLGEEPEFTARLTGGNFGQFDAFGKFALPLLDDTPIGDVRLGGAIAYFSRNGFGENLFLGIDNGNRDVLGGRLSLEWLPTEDVFVRITGDWTDDNSILQQGSRLIPAAFQVNPDTGAPFEVLDSVFDTFAGLNNPTADTVNRGLSLQVEWEVNENITLKSITGYRDNFSALPEDFDSLPAADVDVPVIFEDDQFTQEVQVLVNAGRFNGLVGAFYINANAFNAFDVILAQLGSVVGLPGLNAFTLGDVDTESWAIFGDFTFDITESLSLSFGGRFTSDQRTALVFGQTLLGGFSEAFGGTATPLLTDTNFVGQETFSEFTPRVSLAWSPSPNHNLYVSYAEGFKGGGFDPRGNASVAPDFDGDGIVGVNFATGIANDPSDVQDFFLFEPEEIATYEVGYKSSFFGGRLNQSSAFFFSNYNNVQIPGSVGIDSDGDGLFDSFVGITSNAAEARIFGVEFEGNATLLQDALRAGDRLNVQWGLGYINAEFEEFINAFGDDIADLATFQNTPRYTFSTTFTYTTPLKLFGLAGSISLLPTISYRSTTNQFEISTAALDQPAYVIFNTGLVWTSDNGRLTLSLQGRNLTNTEYIVAGFDFVDDVTFAPQLGLDGILTAFFGPPRQFFGSIEVNF